MLRAEKLHFPAVLVQAAVTNNRLGGLNNRNLFLTVLKIEKPKIKVPVDSTPGEDPHPGLQRDTFLLWTPSSHGIKRERSSL